MNYAAAHRMPVIGEGREWAEAGALLTYSADYVDMYRQSAAYVHKILSGAKPGELPIAQPTKFELFINLKKRQATRHHNPAVDPAAHGRGDSVIRLYQPAFVACVGLFGLTSEANAQDQPRRVGVLLVGYSTESKQVQEFRQGLRDAGYAEGRDVVIEWRSANGDYDRLPELVADLLQRQVEVIVVENTVAAREIKRTTSSLPIVMAIVADPVGSGLVASLAHPGANFTGLSLMLRELSAKRLQILKEALPHVARVAVLWNPTVPWHAKVIEDLKVAAPSLSLTLTFVS